MGGCYGWLLWGVAMGGCYGWMLIGACNPMLCPIRVGPTDLSYFYFILLYFLLTNSGPKCPRCARAGRAPRGALHLAGTAELGLMLTSSGRISDTVPLRRPFCAHNFYFYFNKLTSSPIHPGVHEREHAAGRRQHRHHLDLGHPPERLHRIMARGLDRGCADRLGGTTFRLF